MPVFHLLLTAKYLTNFVAQLTGFQSVAHFWRVNETHFGNIAAFGYFIHAVLVTVVTMTSVK